MSWPARYPGICAADCGYGIRPGQEIENVSRFGDREPEYRHAECPTPDDDRPTRFQGTTLDDMGY